MREVKFLGIIMVAVAVFTTPALGQSFEQNLPPIVLQFGYKAFQTPDRIIMTFGPASSSERTITWRTNNKVGKPQIQWAEDATAVRFYRSPMEGKASSTSLVTLQNDTVLYHTATLKNLKPAQQYVYRVGDGTYWSEWLDFYIPHETSREPFEFIYLGDAQNDVFPLWSRVIRAAYQRAPYADFVMHAGDLINHSQNDYEWGEWFKAGGHILASAPQVISPGNHEYVKDDDGHKTGISPFWDPQFSFPDNGPKGFKNRAYYFDHKNCRIIVLDSNDNPGDQVSWLENLLKNNDKEWVVVMFHHPVISAAEGRMNEGVLKNWKPLLDRYKVDLVLQGHDHVYGRGNQVDSGLNEWDEDSGSVYVVSVAGRKTYEVSDHPWMQKRAGNLQTYQIITVKNQALNYKAYTLDGAIFDEFDLIKRPGQKNELIERGKKK